jgi:hypothetical protein
MIYTSSIANIFLNDMLILKKRDAVNPGVRGSYPTGGENRIKMRRIVCEYVVKGLKAPRRGIEPRT